MSRTAGSKGLRTAAAIHRVGLRLIYKRGFEAMTLRELAAEVGIKPASLYNHIRTKQDLLFDLIHTHMEALLAHADAAMAKAPVNSVQQLRAFVAQHVDYHVEKRQQVFIANFELRALEPNYHAVIVDMRRAYEEKLISVLTLGAAAGEFTVQDVRITAYAILAMLTGACTWYKPEGRLTKAEVAELHIDLVLRSCLPGVVVALSDHNVIKAA